MAIGLEEEFDYLEEEDSDATEEEFAPKIKGARRVSLVPGESDDEETSGESAKEEDIEKEV